MNDRDTALTDAAPILCKQCGAPQKPLADLTIHCVHCGFAEQLPAEQQARARVVRARLSAAAQRSGQLDGLALVFATLFERSGLLMRVSWLWWCIAITLCVILGITIPWESTYATMHTFGILMHTLPALSVALIPFPIVGALVYGRRRYRQRLRPLLQPSSYNAMTGEGACRVCAAPLEKTSLHTTDVFARCRYCSALTLRSFDEHVQQLLSAHHHEKQAKEQMDSVSVEMRAVMRSVRRAMLLTFTLWAVCCTVLGFLIVRIL